ncbi:MAG TPA: glycosyltransferase family 39 protein [Candidatus Binatia bacterium]|nr:glycosyltransferase family 39 protein [Candidatus Binatia bacterium]
MISENFYLHGFNIFYPQINWAGNGPGYVGTEFPLVPFFASLLYVFFDVQDWIGRSVSVGFFALSIPFFYLLVRKVFNERSAWFAIGIYTLAPLSVFAGRSFMPDMAYLAFSIAALYLFTGWLEDEKSFWRFALASTATTLAILVKLPAIIIALPMLYIAWTKYGAMLLRKRDLWAFAVCSLLFPIGWYAHAYRVSLSHYPYHMFGSGGLETVSADWYVNIVQQALTWVATPLTAAAMLLGICLPPQAKFDRLFHWWLVAIVLFMIVAGQGHRHPWYLLPVVPVAAALAGRACDFVLSRIARPTLWNTIVLGSAFFSAMSYLSFVYLKPLYEPGALAPWRAGKELDRIAPVDTLFAAGDGGDPTCIYYSKRKGWHFLENFGAAPIDSKQAIAELEQLKERGAAYLVLTRHQPWWWSERYDNFWSYLDSRYPRARDTEDYVIFELENTELAKRPVVSEPTSKPPAAFQPAKADDELKTRLKPRV